MSNLLRRLRKNLALIITVTVEAISYVIFIISLFNSNEISLSISGLLIVATLLISFIIPILQREKILIIDWIFMLISLVGFVVLLSCYISTIPIDNLRITILQISAASIGGLLTLSGVGLSLKYTRIYKEEDRIEELKPHLYIIGEMRWSSLPKEKRTETVIDFADDCKESLAVAFNFEYKIRFLRIGNSDLSIAILRGLRFNNEILRFKYELPLTKDSQTSIYFDSFIVGLNEELTHISLLCEDIMQNEYVIELGFDIDERGASSEILFKSAHIPQRCEFDELSN